MAQIVLGVTQPMGDRHRDQGGNAQGEVQRVPDLSFSFPRRQTGVNGIRDLAGLAHGTVLKGKGSSAVSPWKGMRKRARLVTRIREKPPEKEETQWPGLVRR
jgi:hypothetical protein